MTYPSIDHVPLDVIAQEVHEHFRRRVKSFPAWDDLDGSDPWHAGLIWVAYERARDLVAILGEAGGERFSQVISAPEGSGRQTGSLSQSLLPCAG